MYKKYILPVIWIFTIIIPQITFGQIKNLSLEFTGGPGFLAMKDFKHSNYYLDHPSGFYYLGREKARKSAFSEISALIKMDNYYSFRFHAAFSMVKMLDEKKVEIYPMGISMEFLLKNFTSRLAHHIGVGPSFMITTLTTLIRHDDSLSASDFVHEKTSGCGLGFHLYYGMNYTLVDGLYLKSRIFVQGANAMLFHNKSDELDVDLTGTYLTLGLGWRFGV